MSMITGSHYDQVPQAECKGIICVNCEENSQEGSDVFSLKGVLAHAQVYGFEHCEKGFEEKSFQAEYIATMGGLCDREGAKYE